MTTETAAPAGASTETVSAERVAADSGNVSAFLDAANARRAGKAPANVERPKAEPAKADRPEIAARVVPGRDGQPAKGPADKDREADERLTSRIREAIDTSTADLRTKNRELEEQLAAMRRGTSTTDKAGAAGGAKAETTTERRALTSAEIKAYQARPGAPQLDDKDASGAFLYETAHEHAIAMAEFIREAREGERAVETRKSSEGVERLKRETARHTTFAGRIEAFKTAHPDQLIDNGKGQKTALPLSPDVAKLHGFGKLHEINTDRQGKGLPPLDATVEHAIAEELYDSAIPMETALYLSTHPEAFAALRSCQTPAQLTRAFGALEERVKATTTTTATAGKADATPRKEPAADIRRKAEEAVDRSVSSTRPLSENLGRAGTADADPHHTAVVTNNYGMFADIEKQKRTEILEGRRRR